MNRQKAYSDRMKAKGNVLVALWVNKDFVERIKKYAKKLRNK